MLLKARLLFLNFAYFRILCGLVDTTPQCGLKVNTDVANSSELLVSNNKAKDVKPQKNTF